MEDTGIAVQTPEGFWVPKGEKLFSAWVEECKRLDHDQYALPKILPYIIPGSLVVDVGAHIGTHTIAYLEAVGEHGIVVAYEPHPANFACLKLNCPKALAFQIAIGATPEETFLANNQENTGASHLTYEDSGTPVTVTTIDLDLGDLIAPLCWRSLSLIKIDAEGCEPEVLIGADKTITTHRPVLWMEIQQHALARRGNSYKEIQRFLIRHKYKWEFYPPDCSWQSEQCDVLAVPRI